MAAGGSSYTGTNMGMATTELKHTVIEITVKMAAVPSTRLDTGHRVAPLSA